ncbi:FG-GAP-like repeat-containing protein [Marivirga arenosa]|uniref:Gliding motility-associated C-terminal domain-containing protein n=1 Tax=Marivirga arenosa TaxID=3059076 RepID=A0AA51ZW98_9BACT|nr:FG-GAP-like repeat-containing protein [Marivirga sp. BKB1-2]WNB17914.1 gliding motility-associated C-terminal domain-containing protein [Marivirga sp. BKB1-2]
MKKLSTLIFALIMVFSNQGITQNLKIKNTNEIIANNVENSFWLDIDNNGLHEVTLQLNTKMDSSHLIVFDWLTFQERSIQIPNLTTFPVKIEDLDNNNQLDVIGFTKDSAGNNSLEIFTQESSNFTSSFKIKLEDVKQIYLEDWNKDGFKDLLYVKNSNDTLSLSLLENSSGGFLNKSEEIAKLIQKPELQFFDFNLDGRNDILITSFDSAALQSPAILINYKDSTVRKETSLPKGNYKSVSLGDYNHDGKTDFFANYSDSNAVLKSAVFINDSTNFIEHVIFDVSGFNPQKSFLADFNSDGLTDIFISDLSQSAFIFQKPNNEYELDSIESLDIQSLSFYDPDRDGDLDITFVTEEDSSGIVLYGWENQYGNENLPPKVPTSQTAFQSQDGVIIVWNDAVDDHTVTDNITYDVFIGSSDYSTEFLSPNFDINSSDRIKTSRGNNSYSNELKLDNLPSGNYSYGIQPIDNSLTIAIPDDLKPEYCPEECGGRYMACGNFEICESVNEQIINTCVGRTITLGDSTKTKYWYSEKNGYLGEFQEVEILVEKEDTLYFRDVNYSDCNSNQIYVINIIDESDYQLNDFVVCEVQELNINLDQKVDSINWYENNNLLSSDFSLNILVENETEINYEAYVNECKIESSFSITIDQSQVEILNNTSVIKRGGQIQLQADGAVAYEWAPNIYLNAINISNPIAIPETTTAYVVKGISANGCFSYDTVRIEVIQEAFIPEMFTPNGDARNDKLRIYGLVDVNDFEFIIYDREGNVVFRSQEPDKMNTSGWDGTRFGNKAEAGIYFWQVRGSYHDGNLILLNGNQKGKILLSK